MRANLLKTTRQEVVNFFVDKLEYQVVSVEEFMAAYCADEVESDEPKQKRNRPKILALDEDLEDMLLFPPMSDFHNNDLFHAGHIILQDKGSALGGASLQPPPEDIVCLDACAAPGQKTTQLAQAMQNHGTLIAIDQDGARLGTLSKLAKKNGVKSKHHLLIAFNLSRFDHYQLQLFRNESQEGTILQCGVPLVRPQLLRKWYCESPGLSS